jgi:hypothetical protein
MTDFDKNSKATPTKKARALTYSQAQRLLAAASENESLHLIPMIGLLTGAGSLEDYPSR